MGRQRHSPVCRGREVYTGRQLVRRISISGPPRSDPLHDVADQVERLAKEERLNEAAAPELAEEFIVCLLTHNKLFASFTDTKTKRLTYPVDLAAVMVSVRRQFLRCHFRDLAIEAKRKRGEIKEEWRGTIVSFSASLRPEEEQLVEAQVRAALASGEPIGYYAHYTDLEELKARLEKALEARLGRGANLLSPVLPHRDELLAARENGEVDFDTLKSHCRRVLELALNSYRRIVETNFPHAAMGFGFYAQGPLRAVLALDAGFSRGDGRSSGVLQEPVRRDRGYRV